jgi:hypothetical protein
LGDDATISKNKETINKPAIAAPINIGTFQRDLYLFTTTYQPNSTRTSKNPACGGAANLGRPTRTRQAAITAGL